MSAHSVDFFRTLFARAPQNSRVCLFQIAESGNKAEHLAPDPEQLAQRALALDAQLKRNENLYFVVCPLREGLSGHQKGKIADVVQVPTLWADIDFAHPTHQAQNLPPDLLSAFSLIPLAGLPDPSILVSSGAGVHAYWVLETPLDPERGQVAVRALQAKIQIAGLARGWHVDNTSNLDRLLRIPGTLNRKDPNNLRLCTLDELSTRKYVTSELVGSAEATSAHAPTCNLSGTSLSLSHGDVASAEPTSVRAHIRRKIGDLKNDATRALARAILAGDPLLPGQRDNDLMRAAGLLAAFAPEDTKPIDIVEILYPSIDATVAAQTDPSNPAPTREDALDKLTRSMRDFARKRKQRQEDAAKLSRGLARAAKRRTRAEGVDPETVDDSPYTQEELERFEVEHGAPLQWIIQKESAHYILVNGQYEGPFVFSDLGVHFKEALAPAPLDLTRYEDGSAKPLTVPEILEKYSTVATKIVADLTLTSGRFDRETKVFYEACAPRTRIAPKFNMDIQRWLELLGADKAGKLLDWVASVTLLEHQCCALYLSQTPGTGKSLLAHGLAKIWAATPTELKNVVGPWTGDIARCPLVVADEYLPSAWLDKRGNASSELRELVGSTSRTLTRKFLPSTELFGAIRLMLLANDQTMLPFNESFGMADYDAIAGRFLHIATPPAAAEFLQSIGGQHGRTRGWIDNNEIAAHALWLRDNRKIEKKGRFLVEGDPQGIRERLITETKVGSLVCEIIARLLSAPKPNTTNPAPIVSGNGALLVSTVGISNEWKYCIESDSVYSTHKIGRQLSAMAHGETQKVRGLVYHRVHPKYVLGWAEKNHVGNVDLMRQRIDAKVIVFDEEEKSLEN